MQAGTPGPRALISNYSKVSLRGGKEAGSMYHRSLEAIPGPRRGGNSVNSRKNRNMIQSMMDSVVTSGMRHIIPLSNSS